MFSCCVNSLTNDWKMLVKQNWIKFLEKGKDKGDVDKTIKTSACGVELKLVHSSRRTIFSSIN